MVVKLHLIAPINVVCVDIDLANDALSVGDVSKVGVVSGYHVFIVVKLVDYILRTKHDQIGNRTCTQGANYD